MSNLGITNDEMKKNVAMTLGISRDAVAGGDTILSADIDRVIRAGRRKFFMSASWHFLDQNISMVTAAPTTVTASCTNGVMSISVGSAPGSPVSNYKMVPAAGGVYDISSASGPTLTNTGVTFASQLCKFYQYRIALPTNFGAFVDPVTVENYDNVVQMREYGTIPDFQHISVANTLRIVTGAPEIFAVNQDVIPESGSFAPYFLMYPLVDAIYTLKTKIKILPGDATTDGTGFVAATDAVLHPVFGECLQEAILASAEQMFNQSPGIHTAMFQQLLPLAVKRDNELFGVRGLLPRGTDNVRNQLNPIRRAQISFQQNDPPISSIP